MILDPEAARWGPERLRMVAAARERMVEREPEVDWTPLVLRDLAGWLLLSGAAAVGFAWFFEDWSKGFAGGVVAAVALFFAGPAFSVRKALRHRSERIANQRSELE